MSGGGRRGQETPGGDTDGWSGRDSNGMSKLATFKGCPNYVPLIQLIKSAVFGVVGTSRKRPCPQTNSNTADFIKGKISCIMGSLEIPLLSLVMSVM